MLLYFVQFCFVSEINITKKSRMPVTRSKRKGDANATFVQNYILGQGTSKFIFENSMGHIGGFNWTHW